MSTVCKCDQCDSEGAVAFSLAYAKPGTLKGEQIILDLCVDCYDTATAILQATYRKMKGREYAAQIRPVPKEFTGGI